MASLTQDMSLSKLWWRTGKSGVLRSMGSQRVGHDWATKQQQRPPWNISLYVYTSLRFYILTFWWQEKLNPRRSVLRKGERNKFLPKDLEVRYCKPLNISLLSTPGVQKRSFQYMYTHQNDGVNKNTYELDSSSLPFYHSLAWMCGWELTGGGKWGKENGVGNIEETVFLFPFFPLPPASSSPSNYPIPSCQSH